jgi:hypothetical protein
MPALVGVPLIVPATLSSIMPSGNAPLVMAKLYGDAPPEGVSV